MMANNNFTYNAPTYVDFNPQTMNEDIENVETFFDTEIENSSSEFKETIEVYPNGSQCTGKSEEGETDKSVQNYFNANNLIDLDFNPQTTNQDIKNVETVLETELVYVASLDFKETVEVYPNGSQCSEKFIVGEEFPGLRKSISTEHISSQIVDFVEISDHEEQPMKLRKSISAGNLLLNIEETNSKNIRKLHNFRISSPHSELRLGNRATRDKSSWDDRLNKLAQPKQVAQQKYVSAAEMINKFYGTPDRFHTRQKNCEFPTGQYNKVQRRTNPQSPCLATKNRQRSHNVLSRSEMEKLEMEEHKKFKIKAHPVNRRVLQGPIKAITIPKKTVSSENHQKKSVVSNEKPFKPVQTNPVPFSFDARDQLLAKRRQAMINKVLEEEKKARKFRANPPPKYVFKKSSSLNSLKSTKSEDEAKDVPTHFKARPAMVLHQKPFVPKKPERPLIEVTELCLNTDRRAKEREEFEKKIHEKMEEMNKVKLLREDEKMRAQQEEIQQLRKQTVHVAQPVRHYKELKIEASGKVTVPVTPKLKTTKRCTHDKENSM